MFIGHNSNSYGYYSGNIDTTGNVNTNNYIWNTGTLAWEKATGGAGAGNVTVTNFPAVYPVNDNGGSLTVDAVSWPLPTGAATSAKQDTIITNLQTLNSLVPALYDYINLGYDANNNLNSAIFKSGGAGGATVSTLTLAYDGSNNLSSVTKT